MVDGPVHRELLLPPSAKDAPAVRPLVWTPGVPFWLEIHRTFTGRVNYSIASKAANSFDSLAILLETTRPRVAIGRAVDCPSASRASSGLWVRAVAAQRHHHLPFVIHSDSDHAGMLLRTLSSRAFRDTEVTLQVLARRVGTWEFSFFSAGYHAIARGAERVLRAQMESRRADPVYHVELRAHILGPRPEVSLAALSTWLGLWTTAGGLPWRYWEVIRPRETENYRSAFANHEITQFANRTSRRDASGTELSHLLSIPWANHHPECSYAGAPAGRPRPELTLGLAILRGNELAPSRHPNGRLTVGISGSHRIGLPENWNHLALLGRTQSGKSTLALNLALQILKNLPAATVVVIEPTGTLVNGLVARLPEAIASDTIEIDPARETFEEVGSTMVTVPLSLLPPAEAAPTQSANPQRWSEAVAGDLILAIRNAWGEESVGGRAELVLRALVQGLALTPGSNLVDAYQILSSKPALHRFVETAPPGPLRDFLERHLPRLGYDFTMSSLDKVGKIATNPLLRIALCQRAHPVSFDRLLKHRLLLLNLSKPALGADGANFLGAIYLTQLWAALQRSGRPDRPVYLVLDEVHNYAVPTLADMLSEGAKFGLHVVAATQYLHRVPPKVRAALLGNVDAWMLFPLGVEDMDDAWRIVNGQGHGWVPQDLVDGLGPHEVALAASRGLVKLETVAAPRPTAPEGKPRARVTQSSRRYAQPEDSEASPWIVDQQEEETTLRAVAQRTREPFRWEAARQPSKPQLGAILTRSAAAGDIVRGTADGTPRLTERGEVHLRVLESRTNEGEEHVATLTDFAIFLRARGIAMAIPQQVAGVLTPDGQFRWGGSTYNVEVECSTVNGAANQVVRNVRKARAAGRRVLIVLPDAARLPRLLGLLNRAFPGLLLWTDEVGVVARDGPSSFLPYRVPGAQVWPFLESDPVGTPSESTEDVEVAIPEVTDTDPLVAALRGTIRDLVAAGRFDATTQELLASLPASERNGRTEQHVGVALRALGLERRRIRVGDARVRVFDLSSMGAKGYVGSPGPAAGPTGGPDLERSGVEDTVGPPRRSTDSPIEDRPPRPTDPAGPSD